MKRLLPGLAYDEGSHLQRTVEQARVAQARVGDIVFNGMIAANRDFIASGPFPTKNQLVGVSLAIAVFINENKPSPFPAAIVRACVAVARFAYVHAISVLDGFASCPLEGVDDEA